MKITKSSSLWLFGFTVLFFLALDFWSWGQSIVLSWLNFPSWMFYFIGLQIIFAIAVTIFSLTFWRSVSDEEKER